MSLPPTLDLPACARALRLRTPRGDFAAHESVPPAGTEVRGTALLVPGFTGSKEDFIGLLEPLAAAGFRVLAIDGRGQHESDGPPEENAYAQGELARDVLAQAAAAVEGRRGPAGRLHLLGHSLGGLITRAAVLLDAAPFASLTIMSSGPAAITEEQQVRTKLLIDALLVMDMESVWQAMREYDTRAAAEPARTGSPEVADIAGAPEVPDATGEFLHRRWLGTVPQQLVATGRQLVTEPDRVAELAAVPLPFHVVSGAVDFAWPVPLMDEMAERLGARRTVVAGAGHSPNAERPEETARALADFWASVPD
ncbi:alpha/beta fold hydrolase [Streptomyces lycii]|uniref:Alpha/beta hydrolase n=1 Tax=Streptomyces lycii TaxID=2654337 RepID=A0ABQ7FQS2_9ACTN|nr:alpha/beta fold hydrolase [Streptomyces lycii]KAF4410353.1 alpha/beta hydrolase [Streptomyces lycii]